VKYGVIARLLSDSSGAGIRKSWSLSLIDRPATSMGGKWKPPLEVNYSSRVACAKESARPADDHRDGGETRGSPPTSLPPKVQRGYPSAGGAPSSVRRRYPKSPVRPSARRLSHCNVPDHRCARGHGPRLATPCAQLATRAARSHSAFGAQRRLASVKAVALSKRVASAGSRRQRTSRRSRNRPARTSIPAPCNRERCSWSCAQRRWMVTHSLRRP